MAGYSILKLRLGTGICTSTNVVMEDLLERKLLTLNLQKSSFLIMGNKKQRKEFQNQLANTPLMLYGEKMQEVKVLKYLGDFLSFDLGESIHQTVVKRLGMGKHAIYELRAIKENTRAEIAHMLTQIMDIRKRKLEE